MSDGIAIGRIQVPKAADVLASELRERILAGQIGEGAILPTERSLAETSGLSRASVREALRILEVEGLITTRLGRNGGSAARRPTHEGLARSVNQFIRGQNILLRSLLEAREAIEPACARLAALHRTEPDIAELGALQERLEAAYADIPAFLDANLQWHLAVVRASHNELLLAFMLAISEALHAGTDLQNFNSDEIRATVMRAHRRVTEAIREGDAEAAERRMERHVRAYAEQVRRRPAMAEAL
ncbi:MAG: FadR family transcriptional regulator [Acidisphaera sp.]|nr:FadR family transcriptional regulator [Acidisphaera sp.]